MHLNNFINLCKFRHYKLSMHCVLNTAVCNTWQPCLEHLTHSCLSRTGTEAPYRASHCCRYEDTGTPSTPPLPPTPNTGWSIINLLRHSISFPFPPKISHCNTIHIFTTLALLSNYAKQWKEGRSLDPGQ